MTPEQIAHVIEPVMASGLVALAMPLVQAVMDRPEWTPSRRRVLALALALAGTVLVWLGGAHPHAASVALAQLGTAVGASQAAFTALKQLGVIDWVGAVTPGGETREAYRARHRAGGAG